MAGPEPLDRRGAAGGRESGVADESAAAVNDGLMRLRVEVDGAGGGDVAGVEEEEAPQMGAWRGWTRGSV